MISPIDKKILEAVATILEEKPTLVKIGSSRFDSQFMGIISMEGLSQLLSREVDHLVDNGLLATVERKDKYIGETTHYIITNKGREAIYGN